MLHDKTIAVVVPAYNEASQIGMVLKRMPEFVDRIVVVNDASTDNTAEIVTKYLEKSNQTIKKRKRTVEKTPYNKAEQVLAEMDQKEWSLFTPSRVVNKTPEEDRIILINHEKNASVGGAIATGYKWCKDHKIDITAVMAGDGQMDPDELEGICMPIINDPTIDYVKGNRLSHRSAFFVIPRIRYFGNSILSLLTKIASGYWRVSDTQTGYTAISLPALEAIRLHNIYKSYGCPNDILVKLNIAFCHVKEVPIKPVYEVGEQSKMKVFKVIPRITWLLFKAFWKRLYVKYLFRDFHPLFLLYHLSFFLLIINIPFLFQVVTSLSPEVVLGTQNLLIFVFLTISGLQTLFFAMWMDMMDNDRLHVA
ncbi:glycosyltransferase family 2 protein [Candidatus Dojkabacteria bacterium]|uniref:Glycosyltransferase family 2 protein n=1 Tax=Candidatus Dojkabacteria bacterium TaxID=2099670 RepID=A0A955L883_9BACT|nr:glycosyltransferase family 2 protein [Candidatus Dojkabacteria bacterium]